MAEQYRPDLDTVHRRNWSFSLLLLCPELAKDEDLRTKLLDTLIDHEPVVGTYPDPDDEPKKVSVDFRQIDMTEREAVEGGVGRVYDALEQIGANHFSFIRAAIMGYELDPQKEVKDVTLHAVDLERLVAEIRDL